MHLAWKQGLLSVTGNTATANRTRHFRSVMAAAPIAVHLPIVPGDPESPLILLAAEPMVAATPCCDWVPTPPAAPGGPARVSLSQFRSFKAFGSRLYTSRTPADQVAARAIHLLLLRFTAAAWGRGATSPLGKPFMAKPNVSGSQKSHL